ncbi:uncharacterized protein PAC_14974 [Phialocephala subalpina]|uniref:Zn(2)-C6 fungal-type domain-containing protein n=1 Tax=Phialocephala subalpina TaxID=576137 RepID=A0A1L7XJ84_9HELO|nr:uncharacterized protein PAC_14974 [Phialocephala subalpina]
MRKIQACRQCRDTKRKCHFELGQQACASCSERGLLCSKTPPGPHILRPASPHRFPNDAYISASELAVDMPASTVVNLVKNYLTCVHDKPHSLFHLPSLWESIHCRSISTKLLYSICALGCRISSDKNMRLLEPRLSTTAKRLFQLTLADVSLESIQTCILIANICGVESDSSSEALYFGIATRMAYMMFLNTTDFAESIIEQETKCRVWCSLFMADRWCSTGMGLPRQIPDLTDVSRLPIDEYVFQQMEFTQQEAHDSCQPGLWAYMILLADIFGPVQDLNRHLVQDHLPEDVLNSEITGLARRLETWKDQLPSSVVFNLENFDRHRALGNGSTFVALHLGYHHYATLLYYRYLDIQKQSTPSGRIYASRCKYHASSYSSLLKISQENQECSVLHTTSGHMTAVSSSVLLHTLLFGAEEELTPAREGLVANFKALVELQKYWPSLEKVDACLRSDNTNTYKVDKWMLRFLLEHAMPLSQRSHVEGAPDTLTDLNHPDGFRERGRMVNDALSGLRIS